MEDCRMKKTLLILAALVGAAFVSCQKENNLEPSEPELGGKTYTLTVQATKAAGTKLLDFDSEGKLITSWALTDIVNVCKHGSATSIGELTPSTSGDALTTLTGDITLTGISVGDKLDLIFPSTNWTYEGQDGTLPTLANNFDFARAEVTVSNISGTTLTASAATFTNEQSLVKFTLYDASSLSLLDVNYITISAASGKLVKSYAVSGDAYTPVYGDLTIAPLSGTANEFYVALRNNSNAPDTYTITAQFGLSTYYTFVKSGVTFANGHYKAINVKMTQESEIYTVGGTPAAVFGDEWSTDLASNDMVKQSDGTYRKTYNIDDTVDYVGFKVVKNRDWSYAWPASDYYIDCIGAGLLTITFNPSTETVDATFEVGHTYTIAGTNNVFGSTWDINNTDNDMVKQDDGTYLKTYNITSVPTVPDIEFKVVQDHAWDNAWPSSNYYYYIPHNGILNIAFDAASGAIDAWMDDYRYTLACDANGWDVHANPMTKNADGTFSCIVSGIPAGTQEFKVVHNEGDWIGDPANSYANFTYDVASPCDLKFTYIPSSGTVTVEELNVAAPAGLVTIDGNFDDWTTATEVAGMDYAGSYGIYDGIIMMKALGDATNLYIYLEIKNTRLDYDTSHPYANQLSLYLSDGTGTTAAAYWNGNYNQSLVLWTLHNQTPAFDPYPAAAVTSAPSLVGDVLKVEFSVPRSYDTCLSGNSVWVALHIDEMYSLSTIEYGQGTTTPIGFVPVNAGDMYEVTFQ